jgi:hypothetical protein
MPRRRALEQRLLEFVGAARRHNIASDDPQTPCCAAATNVNRRLERFRHLQFAAVFEDPKLVRVRLQTRAPRWHDAHPAASKAHRRVAIHFRGDH